MEQADPREDVYRVVTLLWDLDRALHPFPIPGEEEGPFGVEPSVPPPLPELPAADGSERAMGARGAPIASAGRAPGALTFATRKIAARSVAVSDAGGETGAKARAVRPAVASERALPRENKGEQAIGASARGPVARREIEDASGVERDRERAKVTGERATERGADASARAAAKDERAGTAKVPARDEGATPDATKVSASSGGGEVRRGPAIERGAASRGAAPAASSAMIARGRGKRASRAIAVGALEPKRRAAREASDPRSQKVSDPSQKRLDLAPAAQDERGRAPAPTDSPRPRPRLVPPSPTVDAIDATKTASRPPDVGPVPPRAPARPGATTARAARRAALRPPPSSVIAGSQRSRALLVTDTSVAPPGALTPPPLPRSTVPRKPPRVDRDPPHPEPDPDDLEPTLDLEADTTDDTDAPIEAPRGPRVRVSSRLRLLALDSGDARHLARAERGLTRKLSDRARWRIR